MDLAAWEGVFVQAPLDEGDRIRLWVDAHARRDDARFVGIVRPGIGWAFDDHLVGHVGYAWIPSVVDGQATSEHRLWQQLLWTTEVGPVKTLLRPRLEQRFGPAPVGLRARVFGRGLLDVYDPLSIVVWDEVFWGLIASGFGPAGFDQNRLFVGPAVRVERVRVEIGYLDQRLWRDGGWSAVAAVATNVFLAF